VANCALKRLPEIFDATLVLFRKLESPVCDEIRRLERRAGFPGTFFDALEVMSMGKFESRMHFVEPSARSKIELSDVVV